MDRIFRQRDKALCSAPGIHSTGGRRGPRAFPQSPRRGFGAVLAVEGLELGRDPSWSRLPRLPGQARCGYRDTVRNWTRGTG